MNYNYHQADKVERSNRRKALFFTFFVHFALLGGLYYMNSDKAMDVIPEFVMEWFNGEATEDIAATSKKNP